MQTIEIQKGVKVGFEELLAGASQMGNADLEKFTDRLSQVLARRKTPKPAERELVLLKIIYEPFKRSTQKKYDLLHAKLLDETIGHAEYEELLALVEASEAHNVKWLKAVVELARLKGLVVEDLLKQLGLNQLGKP